MLNMKKKRRITAIVLIVLLLALLNSLYGNPVSNSLARKAALQYIDANYSGLNLQIQKAGYNFKTGDYLVFLQSAASGDTAFSLHANSFGEILWSEYEYEVANNFTTYRRLDKELRETAQEIIGGRLPYDFDYISLPFAEEADLTKLTRDMELDIQNPPLPLAADVVLFSGDVSYCKIAEVAKALESILKEQGVPVSAYSVRILPLSNKPQKGNQAVPWWDSLSVTSFPADRMDEKNLPQAMERFETGRAAAAEEYGGK